MTAPSTEARYRALIHGLASQLTGLMAEVVEDHEAGCEAGDGCRLDDANCAVCASLLLLEQAREIPGVHV